MMFKIGDILRMRAPTAGKNKFHICIRCPDANDERYALLFLNSNRSSKDEIVLDCGSIPCLSPSQTGESIISLSTVCWVSSHQLTLYRAERLGDLPFGVSQKIKDALPRVTALTRPEKAILQRAIDQLTAQSS